MSDTAEHLTSRETQDAPGYDESSPPPPLYSYEGRPPPPYSAALEMCPPSKIEKICIYQPTAGYESFRDICPEASSDTTPLIASSSFDDKTVRRAFVRKAFSILTLQLLFIFSVVCVFTFSRGEAEKTSLWAYFSSIIIFIMIATALTMSFSRRHPWNIVGLVLVTLSLSYMVGTIASFHDTTDFVITLGATMTISVAIIAFSAQTYDFTIWFGVLLNLTVDMIMFGFMHILLLHH
ncbi:protein lifeguard 2-like [Lycodopsis pacificus]